jgi:acyl carrier protein
MSDPRDRLNALLIAKFALEPGALTADQTLESLGLDSLDIVKLATAMESEFGIEFDEEELLDNITLGGLVELIEDRLSAAQRG